MSNLSGLDGINLLRDLPAVLAKLQQLVEECQFSVDEIKSPQGSAAGSLYLLLLLTQSTWRRSGYCRFQGGFRAIFPA